MRGRGHMNEGAGLAGAGLLPATHVLHDQGPVFVLELLGVGLLQVGGAAH